MHMHKYIHTYVFLSYAFLPLPLQVSPRDSLQESAPVSPFHVPLTPVARGKAGEAPGASETAIAMASRRKRRGGAGPRAGRRLMSVARGRPPLLFASLQFLSKPPVFVCARIPFGAGAGAREGWGSERARGAEGYRKGNGLAWWGGVPPRVVGCRVP